MIMTTTPWLQTTTLFEVRTPPGAGQGREARQTVRRIPGTDTPRSGPMTALSGKTRSYWLVQPPKRAQAVRRRQVAKVVQGSKQTIGIGQQVKQ